MIESLDETHPARMTTEQHIRRAIEFTKRAEDYAQLEPDKVLCTMCSIRTDLRLALAKMKGGRA